MKIQSSLLEAFYVLAKHLHFTLAAKELGITQSALSQRMAKLEEELECTLIVRDFHDLKLTPAGERLQRYAKTQSEHEGELLQELRSDREVLGGVIRIAAYSSILRSKVIPALAAFQRNHPRVNLSFSSHEVSELPEILSRAQADLILVDEQITKPGIESHHLTDEEYVVIESKQYEVPRDLYLDHTPDDVVTESFFRMQKKRDPYRRSFMGDVYSIIDAVALGYGRAVMSKHLVESDSRLKIVSGFQRYARPVTLNYFKQPFYSKLQRAVIQEIQKKIK